MSGKTGALLKRVDYATYWKHNSNKRGGLAQLYSLTCLITYYLKLNSLKLLSLQVKKDFVCIRLFNCFSKSILFQDLCKIFYKKGIRYPGLKARHLYDTLTGKFKLRYKRRRFSRKLSFVYLILFVKRQFLQHLRFYLVSLFRSLKKLSFLCTY